MKKDESNYHKSRPRFDNLGISGTQVSGGIITGKEKNPELFGVNWVEEAEDMLMTDPVITKCWFMVKQTLLSATWAFESQNEEDETCNELADFANEAFGFGGFSGMMEIPFQTQLEYICQAFPIGFRYFEELYKAGPDSKGRVRIWLKKYADREPTAHLKWLSRDGQELDGVQQKIVGIQKQPQPIPANKLLLITHDQTGSNWAGKGILRSAWWPWKGKTSISTNMTIAADRWVSPTPKLTVDRSKATANGYAQTQVDELVEQGVQQLENYLSTESSYLVENDVVSFSSYAAPTSFEQSPLAIIREFNTEIMAAFLAEFSILGQTSTGARSVGEIHNNTFRRSCISYLNKIADQISGPDRPGGGTIGRLIRWNFGNVPVSKYPRLKHYGLETDGLADSLQQLPALVSSGVLTPNDSLEHAVRDLFGVAQLAENQGRTTEERTQPLSPVGGAVQLAEQLLKKRKKHESG